MPQRRPGPRYRPGPQRPGRTPIGGPRAGRVRRRSSPRDGAPAAGARLGRRRRPVEGPYPGPSKTGKGVSCLLYTSPSPRD
eukprot:2061436-Alexandrium_andersonii.AAC.1